jgi:gliding motility-associated-like protein
MTKKFLSYLWLLSVFIASQTAVQAQLTVTNGNNITLSNILSELTGQGVIIPQGSIKLRVGGVDVSTLSGVTQNSARQMYGRYTSADVTNQDDIGTKGLLITSGNALPVAQPSGVFISTGKGFGGDANLQGTSFDACAIEFDVYPAGYEIFFNYAFASEEYDDYVCSPFNDIFKFLVTGPKPGGGSYNKTNIAVIPGTPPDPITGDLGKPVSINNVNMGGPQCTPTNSSSHPEYFNPLGSPYTAYDQRTKGLVARLPVTPCQKYTFYLVVADLRDAIFDTGVFIQSLNSNPPDVNVTTNSIIKDALESCISPVIKLTRTKATQAEAFRMVLSGTATFLTDYDVELDGVNVTGTTIDISYPIGVFTKEIKVKPKLDGLTEPTETVIAQLFRFSCSPGNDYLLSTNTINILDRESFQILEGTVPNTIFRCTDATLTPKLKGVVADNYEWETVGGTFTCTDASCREIQPADQTTDATYKLKATFGDCILERTIAVNYSVLAVNSPGPICTGQVANLVASGRTNYTWSPATGLSCTNCATPIANPTTTTTYTVTGTEGTLPDGCSSSTNVTVTVINQPGPQFTNLAAQYCANENVNVPLVVTPAAGTGDAFTINGTPATSFNPSVLGPGTYEVKYVKAGTPGVSCADVATRTVLVNALPAITINVASSVCKNGVPIPITATPAGGTFKIGTTTITQIDPALYPVGNVTVTYSITDNNTNCLNTKTIDVAIAPLPVGVWENVDDNYCATDTDPVTPSVRITQTDGSIEVVNFTPFVPSVASVTGPLQLSAPVNGLNGCNTIITKTVNFGTPATLSFTNLRDEYCQQALPIALTATPAGGVFLVDGAPATQLVPMDYVVGDVVLIEYLYNGNGCDVRIEKEVDIVQGTAYIPTEDDLQVCPPTAQGYPLEALTVAQQQAGYSYEWTSTVPAINGQKTRVVYIKEDQSGTHSVLIRDGGNCPVDEKIFNIKIKCNTAFFIPTAFTPNGDTKNEMLQIFGADFTKLRFVMFNRWGEVVFTARSKKEGWDGTVNGKPAPAGVYTWTATYESVLQPGKVIEQRGSVTLIR